MIKCGGRKSIFRKEKKEKKINPSPFFKRRGINIDFLNRFASAEVLPEQGKSVFYLLKADLKLSGEPLGLVPNEVKEGRERCLPSHFTKVVRVSERKIK